MSGDCQLSDITSTLGSIARVSASIPVKVVCVDHRHYKSQIFHTLFSDQMASRQTRFTAQRPLASSGSIRLIWLISQSCPVISMSAAGSNGTARSRRAQSNRASDSRVPSPAGDTPRSSRRGSLASGQTATPCHAPAVSPDGPPEGATSRAPRHIAPAVGPGPGPTVLPMRDSGGAPPPRPNIRRTSSGRGPPGMPAPPNVNVRAAPPGHHLYGAGTSGYAQQLPSRPGPAQQYHGGHGAPPGHQTQQRRSNNVGSAPHGQPRPPAPASVDDITEEGSSVKSSRNLTRREFVKKMAGGTAANDFSRNIARTLGSMLTLGVSDVARRRYRKPLGGDSDDGASSRR